MMTPDLGQLEMVECLELPARTLVAPITIVRDIRSMLGPVSLTVLVGNEDVVKVSSDLFEAYNAWDAARTDVDPLCN